MPGRVIAPDNLDHGNTPTPLINGSSDSIGNEKSIALQSKDTRSLLDVVDTLRSQGISRYIDLPEIIVCGEQSSGKSSVLEAISGVKFPSKDNLCTRFATELILRRGPVAPIKISIVAGDEEDRSEHDKQRLTNFNVSVSEKDLQLEKVIEAAKEAMGIDEKTKAFSADILRLEVSGPDQPHLTLVDLPGLFQAGSRTQSAADSETIQALVLKYMRRPRSIILAVVSAKSDFNNQAITKYSREIDPNGMRTLGLITKPDKLDKGSDMEQFYVELAQNKDVRFRLGWHVLRNRDYESRDSTLEERNRVEEEFFCSGVWTALKATQVGVHSLKPRLSKILKEQILRQLPDVLKQIQAGIQSCTAKLDDLGISRVTSQEQRHYLLRISSGFTSLVKEAADGLYSNPFFGDAFTNEGYHRRLRANVQNILAEFASSMHRYGHTYKIIEEGDASHDGQITRADYIKKVKNLIQRSRGKELPGTFNPLIVEHLFHEQRAPWPAIVDKTMQRVIKATYQVVRAALATQCQCNNSSQAKLLRKFINPRMKALTKELKCKVDELLKPHESTHPITNNHYLTENVQKAQNARRQREITRSLEKFFGGDYTDSGKIQIDINVASLVQVLVSKTEADMNEYASSTATDFMEAYYKVALKTIIDNFSTLAVEMCLIQRLNTLFRAEDVIDMDDNLIASLASEDEELSAERTRCNEKLKVLENGLRALQAYEEYPTGMKDMELLQDPVPGSPVGDEQYNAEALLPHDDGLLEKPYPGSPDPVQVPAEPQPPSSPSPVFSLDYPSAPPPLPEGWWSQWPAPRTKNSKKGKKKKDCLSSRLPVFEIDEK